MESLSSVSDWSGHTAPTAEAALAEMSTAPATATANVDWRLLYFMQKNKTKHVAKHVAATTAPLQRCREL